MFHSEIDRKSVAHLVAQVSDLQASGGLVSFEHGEVVVLEHHCFALIAGTPCTVFFDPYDDLYKVFSVSTEAGGLVLCGFLTSHSLAKFKEKDGFFYKTEGPVEVQRKREFLP